MIRIIVRTDDASMAANIGGDVETTYRTFDVELPEVEAFLREALNPQWKFVSRRAIGVELHPVHISGEGRDG